MATIRALYRTDDSPRQTVFINLSEGVLSLRVNGRSVNAQGGLSATIPITAYANTNRSGYGIFARGVYVEWVDSAPVGYNLKGRLFLPVVRYSRWRDIMPTMAGQYLGHEVMVISKRYESMG